MKASSAAAGLVEGVPIIARMGQHLVLRVLLTATVALGGCSLIYNPNNLPEVADAAVDAPVLDACLLELTSVGPTMVYEGQGDGGSRPAVLVIGGKNIASDALLDIRPAAGAATFTTDRPTVAGDFQWLSVSMTIPVDTNLSADVPLDITVTQMCNGVQFAQTLSAKLTLRGLKELDSNTPGLGDTALLNPLYSKIDLSGANLVTWTGSERVELRATSSIVVAGLQADGGPGAQSTPGAAGPGGCPGGDSATAGDCTGGGGAGASTTLNAGGGGGAGFASTGIAGSAVGQAGGGMAGKVSGSPTIATYDGFAGSSANKASGGGGGGAIVLGNGGGGGGGGGTIELTAGGDVQVTGKITALGGPGAPGNGQGAGGGGAGGVVMLRAGRTLTVGSAAPSIDVKGGAGGTSNSGLAGAGGAGSEGRIRWDAPAGNPAPTAAAPAVPHRGPAFDPATPAIMRTARATFSMTGSTNDSFDVSVVDHDEIQHLGAKETFSNDAARFEVTLSPGHNLVCITLEGGQRGKPEADKCIEVAYLP